VGAASIGEAVTAGGNVRLTSGKKTESISAHWSMCGLNVFLINYQ